MASMKWIGFPDKRLALSGLPWFGENSPRLWRLPKRLRRVVRAPVWELAEMPSGGRIRFASDTTALSIRVSYRSIGSTHNMCGIGKMGIACYVDGGFWKPVWPEKRGRVELIFFDAFTRMRREFTLYLPLYNGVDVHAVGVDARAKVHAPAPFAVKKPVVFYGTSITQGGCASQAGTAYQAIIGRMLNIDFVNLGFSGEGRGEPELAEAVAEIDASCYVLDYAQNCPTVDELRERYLPFIETIRAKHPATPIVCITPIFATRNLHLAEARARFKGLAEVIRRAVAARIAAGDRNIRCVEGLGLLSAADADGFVDGVHPNDLGFEREAERLAPVLSDVLGLG